MINETEQIEISNLLDGRGGSNSGPSCYRCCWLDQSDEATKSSPSSSSCAPTGSTIFLLDLMNKSPIF